MKEAILYEKSEGNKVKCNLCAHRCVINEGKRGICGVRENHGGTLYSLVYGRLVAANVDPIEKKPLFHFLPGSRSFSIATAGCNFRCLHCQNASISQYPLEHRGEVDGQLATAGEVVDAAFKSGCESISYTYTEPTIFMEFAADCARIARHRGLRNVFVSNGFMTPESAAYIIPILDGNNVDLKGDEDFYKRVCAGKADPVMDTIRAMHEGGVWVEVTTLVIPGMNDSDEVLRGIAKFIASVDTSIPWHVTRFHATYKMTGKPTTPTDTLIKARQIGLDAGLKYVYLGNTPDETGEDTHCPSCKRMVIMRRGFTIIKNELSDGRCPNCGYRIEGVW
ncbi:MAG: AmmeMemoRadiSam system radical SAM enzyme [Nitrospirae bacterium]|nr:AmmeMemoRadiSam system radical SAM enzyme [Nitrospirota bacterium]